MGSFVRLSWSDGTAWVLGTAEDKMASLDFKSENLDGIWCHPDGLRVGCIQNSRIHWDPRFEAEPCILQIDHTVSGVVVTLTLAGVKISGVFSPGPPPCLTW